MFSRGTGHIYKEKAKLTSCLIIQNSEKLKRASAAKRLHIYKHMYNKKINRKCLTFFVKFGKKDMQKCFLNKYTSVWFMNKF